jgi:hypothetical protein
MLYQTMIAPYTLVVAPPVNTTGTFTFGTYRLEAKYGSILSVLVQILSFAPY